MDAFTSFGLFTQLFISTFSHYFESDAHVIETESINAQAVCFAWIQQAWVVCVSRNSQQKGRRLKRLLPASFSWSTQSPMHITLPRYFRPHFSLCMRLFITSHIIRKTQWNALHTCMPQRQLRCICMTQPLVIFGQQLTLNATTSCCHVPAVIAQSNQWSSLCRLEKQTRMIVCICVLGGCQLLQLYPAHFGFITYWHAVVPAHKPTISVKLWQRWSMDSSAKAHMPKSDEVDLPSSDMEIDIICSCCHHFLFLSFSTMPCGSRRGLLVASKHYVRLPIMQVDLLVVEMLQRRILSHPAEF